jgi:RNA polymerase sigma-70 factor (ECF subfamily)
MEKRRRDEQDAWFRALHERHYAFVWRTLRHLGVQPSDLSDACQDVFIVVHRRFPTFEARGQITTWLFRICFNLARDRRRRVHVQHEVLGEEALAHAVALATDPLREMERQDKLALFELALQNMDYDQRAAFVLFEIEGMTGPEAAAAMDVPLGTAYSRLRLARQAFVGVVESARAGASVRHARGGAR